MDHIGNALGIDGRAPGKQVGQHGYPRIIELASIGILFKGIDDGDCLALSSFENHVGQVITALEQITARDIGDPGVKDGRLNP